jgi:hypothetical protein
VSKDKEKKFQTAKKIYNEEGITDEYADPIQFAWPGPTGRPSCLLNSNPPATVENMDVNFFVEVFVSNTGHQDSGVSGTDHLPTCLGQIAEEDQKSDDISLFVAQRYLRHSGLKDLERQRVGIRGDCTVQHRFHRGFHVPGPGCGHVWRVAHISGSSGGYRLSKEL